VQNIYDHSEGAADAEPAAAGLAAPALAAAAPRVDGHGPAAALVCFLTGDAAMLYAGAEAAVLHEAVLRSLVRLLGEEARTRHLECLSYEWGADEWSRGCPVNLLGPGNHARHAAALGAPLWEGRLLWASTEAAAEFTGYIEGAIRAGEAAADAAVAGAAAAPAVTRRGGRSRSPPRGTRADAPPPAAAGAAGAGAPRAWAWSGSGARDGLSRPRRGWRAALGRPAALCALLAVAAAALAALGHDVERARRVAGQPDFGVRHAEAAAAPRGCAEAFALVVGAGPAGLAVGARLMHLGAPFAVLEKEGAAGASWRGRYERLHLHTHRSISALPYWPFPAHFPEYIAKDDLADYYAGYARLLGAHVHYNTSVVSARRTGGAWVVTAADGRTWRASALVMCTGQEG